MDHHQLLTVLTTNEKQEGRTFDENLQQIIFKVVKMLPEEDVNEVANFPTNSNFECTIRQRYVHTVLYVLKSLKNSELAQSDTFLSVNQQKTVKAAIEIVVSIGILPCLFPGIGAGIYKLCPRAKELDDEKLTDLQKYERLCLTARYLTDFFDEASLRLSLLPQLGPLLGGLLQLSYAPLMKSTEDSNDKASSSSSSEFRMTKELHEKLTKDQIEFRKILSSLIEKCPLATIVKEFMIILGIKEAPKWIRKHAQNYLVSAIVRPHGILALIDAVCGDHIDLGAHWDKLDTVARLVVTSHGQDVNKYYDAVCSQLVALLSSKNINHSATIATNCITALYEHKPEVCKEKVIRVITSPLRKKVSKSSTALLESEIEITECIENLTKCFVPNDAKFKHPPCTVLREIALPLFSLYTKSRGSVSLLQKKIRDLLIHVITDSKTRDNLFSAFLNHERTDDENLGERLSWSFGPTGGLVITDEMDDLDSQTAAECLFDLIENEESLGFDLFYYLLRSLSNLYGKSLQLADGAVDKIGKELATMEFLSKLAASPQIQKALIKNPEPIISFIKTLFDMNSTKPIEKEDANFTAIYIGLMLVRVILTDNEKPKDWTLFNELAEFLTEVKTRGRIPEQLSTLVEELLGIIKNQGKRRTQRYQDLSVDGRGKGSDFEKAIKDLADPLLPVRGHGLIALTKLLEKKDPEAVANKDIILCFFQENLKHEDSFIYLSAVNGLCVLATLFPEKVIEILIQEYVDMPQRNTNGEIAPENRAKLGEILVKTARALGEMCHVHKNVLINGFLSATRDPDDMVRASSLSCLGEICKVMGFQLGDGITEILYCVGHVIHTDKSPECRRAAVLVTNLLIQGLGKDVLTDLGHDLVPLYRALKLLRDNDDDHVLRLHAQLALEELDDIVRLLIFSVPKKLEKRIYLLP
ncbi:transport and Golgi organization protein 6 homolog [Venturia canescens]|uniref:transport and Golgi organization protein 6 homolog n=1 Tax=Venturia canescens TaxID=32260 RepID=UPI001C9BDF1D|nr:transport and Golgi organization protein 6 homolog [Venturia canescens]